MPHPLRKRLLRERPARDRLTTRDVAAIVLAALWCAAEIAHAYAAYFNSG
jgi:hypothetical protein